MAWGRQDQPRQPKRNVVVDFDYGNRTYRVELANTSGTDPEDPLPIALNQYFNTTWKFTDMFTGQIIMVDLASVGPIRVVPTHALQQQPAPQ